MLPSAGVARVAQNNLSPPARRLPQAASSRPEGQRARGPEGQKDGISLLKPNAEKNCLVIGNPNMTERKDRRLPELPWLLIAVPFASTLGLKGKTLPRQES